MVSSDHFQGHSPKFNKWFRWKELLQYSGLLINQRPGHPINQKFIDEIKSINPDILLVESSTVINTSSSQIRAGFNVAENLSADILQYVQNHNLY
jgi:nicotinic acid mononucleotide adenylyltransferase